MTNPEFRGSASYVSDRLEGIVAELIDAQLARGRVLGMDREALRVLVVANVQGLTTYFLEHGDTPSLRAAIEEFQRFLRTVATPPERRSSSARRSRAPAHRASRTGSVLS